ncbi:MAG: HAD family phosphatase [Planctomycetes bacterium]|nr:HAD family phosphatase [Planctomycetota bacterium]
MPQAAVIWDVDGTLVDTAELHFDAWVKLAAEINKPFTHADFAATFGRRNPEIIRFLFGEHQTDAAIAELGDRKEQYYRSEAAKGVYLLPGVQAMLEAFAGRGISQAIGSSAPRGNLELILDLTNSRRFFEGIVAMEDTQRGKPDPQVFLKAAEKLNAKPANCIVFEDAVAGVQAAKAGGMQCVAVRFVGHHTEEALRQAGADLVVSTLETVKVEEVLRLVK